MIFKPTHRDDRTDRWKRRYAAYELAYTLIDFGAALCFVVGSVMFFYEAWQTPGTWLFLVGSILFACKPTLRLVREIHLAETGHVDRLADRLGDEN